MFVSWLLRYASLGQKWDFYTPQAAVFAGETDVYMQDMMFINDVYHRSGGANIHHMAMNQYLLIQFLEGWASINPSYFHVNYRGTLGFDNIHHICFGWEVTISNPNPHLPLFHTEMEQFSWSISTLMPSMPCQWNGRRETKRRARCRHGCHGCDHFSSIVHQWLVGKYHGTTFSDSILTLRYGGGSKPIIINSNGILTQLWLGVH